MCVRGLRDLPHTPDLKTLIDQVIDASTVSRIATTVIDQEALTLLLNYDFVIAFDNLKIVGEGLTTTTNTRPVADAGPDQEVEVGKQLNF